MPILLTNEIFIRVPAQRLKDRLDSLFGKPEVHLYFYLRPHIEMVTASYLQEIKTGFLRARLPRVINKLLTRREIDFCPVIEEFKAVFGAGHVHCRDYAREHFPSGNVLQDIPDFFKLPVLGDPALVAPSGMQNISPGAEAAALLLHLRQFLPEAPERNAYLNSATWCSTRSMSRWPYIWRLATSPVACHQSACRRASRSSSSRAAKPWHADSTCSLSARNGATNRSAAPRHPRTRPWHWSSRRSRRLSSGWR